MDGAEESLASSEAVAQMTDAERAQARRQNRAWTKSTEQYCDRELFADDDCGRRRLDCDRAVGLIDP